MFLFLPFSLSMVVVVVRLYVAVVLLFGVLNEENSFEEFRTDSESALVSKVGNIGFDGYIGTCILWIYRIYRRYIDRWIIFYEYRYIEN